MHIIKQINGVISFLIEVIMLTAMGYCVYHLPNPFINKYIFAAVVPFLVIILWGIFLAPRAKNRLRQPFRALFKLVLFLICAGLLYQTGHVLAAAAFGSVAIFNEFINLCINA